MTTSPAIRQAGELLNNRRTELQRSVAEFGREIDEISAALRNLGVKDATAGAFAVTATAESGKPGATPSRRSVRTVVRDVLESDDSEFDNQEIVKAIQSTFGDRDALKLRANVRSALFRLVEEGIVLKVDRGLHVAAKWRPTNAESPASTGLSDLSVLDPEGGERLHDQGVHQDAEGANFANRYTQASVTDRGAPVGAS